MQLSDNHIHTSYMDNQWKNISGVELHFESRIYQIRICCDEPIVSIFLMELHNPKSGNIFNFNEFFDDTSTVNLYQHQ